MNNVMMPRRLAAAHAISTVELAMEEAGGAGFCRAQQCLHRRFKDVQGVRYFPAQLRPQAEYVGTMALGLPIDEVL